MANVIGLSFFFHDSAAAIVVNGTVVAACAEERFTRRKHTSEFPKYALQYCLEAAGLTSINDVDAVVFYEKPVVKLARVVESLIGAWPRGLHTFATRLPEFLSSKTNVYRTIEKMLPGYRGDILFSDHHLSHAAAAFLCSPFPAAAILTVDGVGERETTTIGIGNADGITLSQVLHFPHSVGLLYSALTGYLGFRVNDGEWKVMGLAPYGRPTYIEQLRQLVHVRGDGSFAMDMRYFVHDYSSTWIANLPAWERLLGFSARAPGEELAQRHQDLARSGQLLAEELMLGLATEARRVTGCDNLVIGGGVGLNSVANWKIEESGLFENVWIHPAPGDDGGALGAAMAVSRLMYDDPRPAEMRSVALGPAFDNALVKAFLASQHQEYESLDDAALVEAVADLIAAGQIVGWCRGRMEFGPRALGQRSILGNAGDPEMKTRINARVKFREYFRPFAPAVPLDQVHEYFSVEPGTHMPFMIKVPQVRPDKRGLIPAVTHEDGSGRVQTVTEESNPLYYRMLNAVGQRTGIPVVVNTSFNVRGEPVVCTPADAYRTYKLAGLDALVLENCLIRKPSTADVDTTSGYAASDRLERAIGEQESAADQATDYFRYGNAIDAAAGIRKTNPVRKHRAVHQALQRGDGIRAAHYGAGGAQCANALAFHYACDVVAVDPHPPARAHATAIAAMLVGRGRARFLSNDDEACAGPFDLMSFGADRSDFVQCFEHLAATRGMLTRGGWVRFDAPAGPGSLTADTMGAIAKHGLEIVSTKAIDGRLVVWTKERA